MGVQTIIHGHIILEGDCEKSRQYIKNLKADNNYPYLSSEMFSLGASESPYFYRNPVISFGVSYKEMEDELDAFLLKFENILRNIEFESARLHMETEFFGNYNFYWASKAWTKSVNEEDALIETEEWFFGYGHRGRWGNLDEPLKDKHIFNLFHFTYPVIDPNKYDLYCNDIKIGTVTETDWDMRSSGTIVYAFDYLADNPENSRLADFIKSSIKTFIYLEEGDEENFQKMCKEEETLYLDLMESANWYLINYKKETIKILCPIFLEHNEITWQKD